MVLFRSIRSKIIVGVVALLLLMAVSLTVVATERTESALRLHIRETQGARAGQVSQSLAGFSSGVTEYASESARIEALSRPITADEQAPNGTVPLENRTQMRDVLAQLVRGSGPFSSVVLFNLTGAPLLSYPPEEAWDVAERPPAEGVDRYRVLAQLSQQQKQNPAFITRGNDPGTWDVVASVRSLPDNIPWAMLVFNGRNEVLKAILDEAEAAPEDLLFILSPQRRVLAGPDGFAPGYDMRQASTALERAEDAYGVIKIGDVDYVASQITISGPGWHIILATEEGAAFAAVDDILRSTVLISMVALLVGIVLSLVLGHDVGVPVRRLIIGAERVTAGEYGTQVRVATRDELADLAGAFNSMSARLLEENQRLIRYQETLEDTVAERTRELREKNDELEAFVYAASHDLRTPIISLDWLVRELADTIPEEVKTKEIREALDRMEANIEGMDDMVADLLELSRIGRTEGQPSAVPLKEVLAAVVDELGARMRERGMTLDADLDRMPTVRADRRRMHQVFVNLLGNAIKYGADQDGRITVRALPIGDPERPVKWRIEVADNGPGIAEEYRDRVFMLFQRAPDPLGRSIEGTGIGLAMVRKIIRAYGGDVRVGDAPGGGALFWLTLPSMHAPQNKAARPLASSTTPPRDRDEAPPGDTSDVPELDPEPDDNQVPLPKPRSHPTKADPAGGGA